MMANIRNRKVSRLSTPTVIIAFVSLAVAISLLSYQAYRLLWRPFTGYGEVWINDRQNHQKDSFSAGDLTHFHSDNKAFEQSAPYLSSGLEAAFERGDKIFGQAFSATDGLGPLFNNSSCDACHPSDGRAQPPAGPDEPIEGGFLRVSIPGIGLYGEPLSPPGYGLQISDRAIKEVKPEAHVRIKWHDTPGVFPDGESYSLRQPEFLITDLAYGALPPDTQITLRLAPPVFGLGLLEAIPERTLLYWADPDDRDGDGISGRPNYVWDLERGGKAIGRFSWKSNAFDIRQQAATAAFNDMGINNELFLYRYDDQSRVHKTRQNCEPEQLSCLRAFDSKEFELRPDQLKDLTTYLQLLGVVYRRNMETPQVQQGMALFNKIGCEKCHKSRVITGEHEIARLENQLIRPYTDLLLHDMGEGLSGGADFDATAQEWRTAPLWGIGMTRTVNGHTHFLHDGRARNIQEAILWHGGEAEQARQKYIHLKRESRQAILKFIGSL
ncbi:di-heme oxidoredictase family protein [Amphritea pacifica]|uniref:di-heme oxidoreductase family protein n=1 Tax=Amphritea pacifica TaxID=2811233 RepID=UPI0019643AB5|nr:di-heme oxidoredictase family protein [Amphritea pacifica]MBN1008923.1 thiol oxidoreductase [Amphritea pacifica]